MDNNFLEMVIVRHGQIEGVRKGMYYGATDYQLSEEGKAQAEAVGRRLNSEHFDAVYVSTLTRAKDTLRILAQCAKMDINPIEDARLREMDFGSVEGYDYARILNEYPELAQAMNDDWMNAAFPKGESPSLFIKRVHGFFEDVMKAHTSGKILVVAHGGTVRAALCSLLELSNDFFWRFKCDYTSITRIESVDGYCVLHTLNS